MVDLGKLVWSFAEKKEVRQAIDQIFLEPRKVAEAAYQAKVADYTNPNPEVRLLASGKDGAAIFMALWNLPSLLNQLRSLGTKAKDLGNSIKDRLKHHPKDVDLNTPGDTPFYQYFNNIDYPEGHVLNWTDVDITDFHKYIGKFPHAIQARFSENPWLIGAWKELKDQPNICNILPGQGCPDGGIDFGRIIEGLPTRLDNPEFLDKFKELFVDAATGNLVDPARLEKFLGGC